MGAQPSHHDHTHTVVVVECKGDRNGHGHSRPGHNRPIDEKALVEQVKASLGIQARQLFDTEEAQSGSEMNEKVLQMYTADAHISVCFGPTHQKVRELGVEFDTEDTVVRNGKQEIRAFFEKLLLRNESLDTHMHKILDLAKLKQWDSVYTSLDKAKYLVSYRPSECKFSLLHLAVKEGNATVVTTLIEKYGADPLVRTGDGETAEDLAKTSTVGAALTRRSSRGGKTPTHLTQIDELSWEMIDLAEQKKWGEVYAKIDKAKHLVSYRPDESNYGLLQHAASQGDMHAVTTLVDKYHADTHMKSKNGKTVHDIARVEGHVRVVRYLDDLNAVRIQPFHLTGLVADLDQIKFRKSSDNCVTAMSSGKWLTWSVDVLNQELVRDPSGESDEWKIRQVTMVIKAAESPSKRPRIEN